MFIVGESSGEVDIPLDLKLEIFKKLPTKSVVRFLCVSKLWKTIIKDFIIKDSIVTRSLTQLPRDPHFIFQRFLPSNTSSSNLSIAYSPHQTTNKEELLSFDETLRNGYGFYEFQYVRGLIGYKSSLDHCCRRFTVYNPTTKQYVSLVYNSTQKEMYFFFFGYDPLSNQYKVVYLARRFSSEMPMSCRVYTLGNSKKQWRNIPCRIELHYPSFLCSICINGVIYYKAIMNSSCVLVSVDLGSERFNHVQTPEELSSICLGDSTLIDYKGKLGCICKDNLNVDLWVLENASKWSKINTYVDVFRDLPNFFQVAGITHPVGEMVIVSQSQFTNLTPLTVYYYDMKLKKRRRVDIKTAMSSSESISIIKVITHHVENIICLS